MNYITDSKDPLTSLVCLFNAENGKGGLAHDYFIYSWLNLQQFSLLNFLMPVCCFFSLRWSRRF